MSCPDYVLLQQALAGLSKRDAVAHLLWLFPHRSRSWFERNLPLLMSLDPLGLSRVLPHADPTGETAVRNLPLEYA